MSWVFTRFLKKRRKTPSLAEYTAETGRRKSEQHAVGQKQHGDEQECNDPGADPDFLEVAGEDTDDDVGQQTECDAIGNGVGKGHHRRRQENRNRGFEYS